MTTTEGPAGSHGPAGSCSPAGAVHDSAGHCSWCVQGLTGTRA